MKVGPAVLAFFIMWGMVVVLFIALWGSVVGAVGSLTVDPYRVDTYTVFSVHDVVLTADRELVWCDGGDFECQLDGERSSRVVVRASFGGSEVLQVRTGTVLLRDIYGYAAEVPVTVRYVNPVLIGVVVLVGFILMLKQ